jgi:hypothetical protein
VYGLAGLNASPAALAASTATAILLHLISSQVGLLAGLA